MPNQAVDRTPGSIMTLRGQTIGGAGHSKRSAALRMCATPPGLTRRTSTKFCDSGLCKQL
jgi:hypothetical protein